MYSLIFIFSFFSSILKTQNFGLFFIQINALQKNRALFCKKTTEYFKYHSFCCHNAKNSNTQEGEKGGKKRVVAIRYRVHHKIVMYCKQKNWVVKLCNEMCTFNQLHYCRKSLSWKETRRRRRRRSREIRYKMCTFLKLSLLQQEIS